MAVSQAWRAIRISAPATSKSAIVPVTNFRPVKFARAGYVVAEIDKLLSCLNPRDIGIYSPHGGKIIVGRERQVALAGTHIDDLYLLLVLQRRVIEKAAERFDKFIDLPPFVLLLIANDAVIGGNAEGFEIKTRPGR